MLLEQLMIPIGNSWIFHTKSHAYDISDCTVLRSSVKHKWLSEFS